MVRKELLAAALVVAIANGAMVGLAARNRGGPREATLVLTEREFGLPYMPDAESTGLSLQLRPVGRVEDPHGRPPLWFDQRKLESLGFDCRMPLNHRDAPSHYARQLPRRAFAVLEFEGEPWRQRLDVVRVREAALADAGAIKSAAESATVPPGPSEMGRGRPVRPDVDREALTASRLTVVDVGRDPAALRRLHPDRTRFIVIAATIRPEYVAASADKPPRLSGRVTLVWPNTLHVPNELAKVLAPLVVAERTRTVTAEPHGPRYAVTVSWGRRLEPWISDLRLLGASR